MIRLIQNFLPLLVSIYNIYSMRDIVISISMYTGVDFKVKTVVLDAKRVKLSIWVSEDNLVSPLHWCEAHTLLTG